MQIRLTLRDLNLRKKMSKEGGHFPGSCKGVKVNYVPIVPTKNASHILKKASLKIYCRVLSIIPPNVILSFNYFTTTAL